MAATETYYQNKIQELEQELAIARAERELFKDALNRWEINAKDVGWKPEAGGSASWLRSLARDNAEIPMYVKVIRDLSESVDRLSRSLTEANSKAPTVYSNWKDRSGSPIAYDWNDPRIPKDQS